MRSRGRVAPSRQLSQHQSANRSISEGRCRRQNQRLALNRESLPRAADVAGAVVCFGRLRFWPVVSRAEPYAAALRRKTSSGAARMKYRRGSDRTVTTPPPLLHEIPPYDSPEAECLRGITAHTEARGFTKIGDLKPWSEVRSPADPRRRRRTNSTNGSSLGDFPADAVGRG